MKIPCEQASLICNKAQYGEAGLLERLKLGLHILVCRSCSSYVKKNRRLSSLCEKARLYALSPKEKNLIKERLSQKT